MHPSVRIRPDIAMMEGYTFISGPYDVMSQKTGVPADQLIKLDTNENLYGMTPEALVALNELHQHAHIYPDVESRHLRALLTDYLGVGAEYILVGAGADELIDLTLRLFLEPNDTLLNCPPTFTMYSLVARWIGNCRVVDVPRFMDFGLNIEAIEQAAQATNAKLLFLCSPNNPDGSLISATDLERLLQLPLVIVLDEAYIEFSDSQSFVTRVPEVPNLIILRTFSKWAGMAGLRIGYGVYPLEIISHLWKIKHPFNVNIAADLAAQATLKAFPQATIQKIIGERERMRQALAQIPYLSPLPSQGNFVLCRVRGFSTIALKAALDARGILIRNYPNKPGLADCIRISVGKPEHTNALIHALIKIGEGL